MRTAVKICYSVAEWKNLSRGLAQFFAPAVMALLASCAAPPPAQVVQLRVEVSPAVSFIGEQQGVALVNEGGSVRQIPVRSSRQGNRVTLTNTDGQKLCDLDLNAANASTCFGTTFSGARAFPLSRMGTSAQPFVFAGQLGRERLAIFIGTEGISHGQMCWRLTTTISRIAQDMGRQACPNEPARIAVPIVGTRVSYSDGADIEVREAREGSAIYRIEDSGRFRIVNDGYIGIIRSMARINTCLGDREVFIIDNTNIHRCERSANNNGYSHSFQFSTTDAQISFTDQSFVNRGASVDIEQRGNVGNTFHGFHNFLVWNAVGIPIQHRRNISAGTTTTGTVDFASLTSIRIPGP